MRLRNFMLVCAGVLSALAFISEVKSEEPVVVEGKILVLYESSLSAQEIETIEKEFGLQRLNYMPVINTGYYRVSGSEDQIGFQAKFLKPNSMVVGVVYQDKIITFKLPIKVELKVKEEVLAFLAATGGPQAM